MTERACAPVDVQLFMRNAQILGGCHGDHREGFIDFKQIDIFDLPIRLVQQFADRRDRRSGVPGRILAMRRMALDFCKNGEPVPLRNGPSCQNECGGTVGIGRGACRCDCAICTKGRFRLGIFSGETLSGCSSVSMTCSPALVVTVTGAISWAKAP